MRGQPTIIYNPDRRGADAGDARVPPVIRTFAGAAGINIETSDIRLRHVLAEFPENLTDEQRVPDNLAELGALTQNPDTNIIRLPNISASVPQLVATIKELKAKGYDIPGTSREPERPR